MGQAKWLTPHAPVCALHVHCPLSTAPRTTQQLLKTACHPLAHTAPCCCVLVSWWNHLSTRCAHTASCCLAHCAQCPFPFAQPSNGWPAQNTGCSTLATRSPPLSLHPLLTPFPLGTTLITPLPHPPSCKFALRSGTTLFTVKYHAASPKAVIVFVHGFTDHAQRHISGTWQEEGAGRRG